MDSRRGATVFRAALPGMSTGAGQPWSLPGFDVQELLGYGATGEVWRAVDVATGEVVALKRLRPGADPAAVDALRTEAAVLRGLDTPHVVRLRAVVGEGSAAVLVLDHAAGGSLAGLLSRRGALDPGEVVTVAAPLAAALAAAHARGVVHGDVTPANVLFTATGMPLLSDLGLARLAGGSRERLDGTAEYLDPAVAAGAEPSAASDVWGLAAVCHHLLAGSPPHEGGSVPEVLAAGQDGARAPLGLLAPHAPRALVEVVEQALERDPAQRPDAAAFAAALRRAHAAAPVRLSGPKAAAPTPPVRSTHAVPRHAPPRAPARDRRLPRWALPAGAAAGLLVAAAALGWWLGRTAEPRPAASLPVASAAPATSAPFTSASSEPVSAASATSATSATSAAGAAPPSTTTPASARPTWERVLDGLDAARASAYEAGDVAALTAVYHAGSPGLAADAALLGALVRDGRHATGVRHELRSVAELEAGPGTAVLRVRDVLAGYEVRSADGAVVQRVPARGEATYRVELARTPAGWRIVQVRPET